MVSHVYMIVYVFVYISSVDGHALPSIHLFGAQRVRARDVVLSTETRWMLLWAVSYWTSTLNSSSSGAIVGFWFFVWAADHLFDSHTNEAAHATCLWDVRQHKRKRKRKGHVCFQPVPKQTCVEGDKLVHQQPKVSWPATTMFSRCDHRKNQYT